RRESGIYCVGAKVLALSNRYEADAELVEAARPIMDALRAEQTWPSDLAVFDHDAMVVVDVSILPGTFSFNRKVGSRLPVLNTSLGRAFLASCQPDKRREIVEWLAPTGSDPGEAGRLLEYLEVASKRGYAIGDAEYHTNIRSVAVPVRVGGKPRAAMNMMTVASLMDIDEAVTRFAAALKDAAQSIELNTQAN
ncbi:MAG: IclR family transcriptional regulator domain-containing protein, partial [Alphaproteobacteria bacterium]